jgi:hypothetical protein
VEEEREEELVAVEGEEEGDEEEAGADGLRSGSRARS